MRLVVNAKRWDKPIDSQTYLPEGYSEIRLVQREDGQIVVYVNGNDDDPVTLIEPNYNGGGERLYIYGDKENVTCPVPMD